jgi:hypothetical protein
MAGSDIFPQNPSASEALRLATSLKDAGEINEAIQELLNFRKLVECRSVIYPVETFLRLPMYLQEAGRRDEAWDQFYKLLDGGYPNQLPDAGVKLAERSIIYDKMRLFLQRDGNERLAIHFGVMSMAAWLAALDKQARRGELKKEQEKIQKKLSGVLAKAKEPELIEPLTSALLGFIKDGFNLKYIERESRLACGIE